MSETDDRRRRWEEFQLDTLTLLVQDLYEKGNYVAITLDDAAAPREVTIHHKLPDEPLFKRTPVHHENPETLLAWSHRALEWLDRAQQQAGG